MSAAPEGRSSGSSGDVPAAAFAGLHPQVRELLGSPASAAIETSAAHRAGLEAMRAGYRASALELGGGLEPVERVEDIVIPRPDGGRIPARAYWPQTCDDPAGVIVWLHGGGWCLGDLESFDRLARGLANAACLRVVTVDYRLAPEHRYPAGLVDAEAAVAWALGPGAEQLGHDPARVVVGGDSAGGNLAAVAVRKVRGGDAGGRGRVRAQLLAYPVTDAAMAGRSYTTFADGPMLTAEEMRACWAIYLGDEARACAAADDPDLSPLCATDVSGLPPTLVLVAGHDPLRDDGVAYAEKLRAAGVPCELTVYEDMAHSFLRWGGVVDRSREALEELAAFARGHCAAR